MQKLTRDQAAYLSIYTGLNLGSFKDIYDLTEEVLGRKMTQEELDDKNFLAELRDKIKPDIARLRYIKRQEETKLKADPLKLAAKHGIGIQFSKDYAVAYAGSVHSKQFSVKIINGDAYTAISQAITKAVDSLIVPPYGSPKR